MGVQPARIDIAMTWNDSLSLYIDQNDLKWPSFRGSVAAVRGGAYSDMNARGHLIYWASTSIV